MSKARELSKKADDYVAYTMKMGGIQNIGRHYIVESEELTIYTDPDESVNYINTTHTLIGDPISLTVATSSGDLVLEGKFNQNSNTTGGTRVDFLKDEVHQGSKAYIRYLREHEEMYVNT
jgi:hypothetical protein